MVLNIDFASIDGLLVISNDSVQEVIIYSTEEPKHKYSIIVRNCPSLRMMELKSINCSFRTKCLIPLLKMNKTECQFTRHSAQRILEMKMYDSVIDTLVPFMRLQYLKREWVKELEGYLNTYFPALRELDLEKQIEEMKLMIEHPNLEVLKINKQIEIDAD